MGLLYNDHNGYYSPTEPRSHNAPSSNQVTGTNSKDGISMDEGLAKLKLTSSKNRSRATVSSNKPDYYYAPHQCWVTDTTDRYGPHSSPSPPNSSSLSGTSLTDAGYDTLLLSALWSTPRPASLGKRWGHWSLASCGSSFRSAIYEYMLRITFVSTSC